MAAEKKSLVEYNYLSDNCGLKVSNLCLGGMTFGGVGLGMGFEMPGNTDEAGSHAIMDKFFELGGNFIDTANIYSKGESEAHIGSWLKKRGNREEMVIATKVRGMMNPTDPNGMGLSRKHIIQQVESSLKNLQTDYIDLYLIHVWDYGVPIGETLSTLNDLVRCGKVRYVGGSNVSGWQLQKIVDLNRTMGFSQFVALQAQYNLLCRDIELELFDVCKNEGLGIQPWSPLKAGMLTGKFKRGDTAHPPDTRIGKAATDNEVMDQFYEAKETLASDSYWNIIAALEKIGKNHGKTVPQVALRWLVQRYPVSSVVIGAKNVKQLEDNMGAGGGWSITEEEMCQLNTVSKFKEPYPYRFINHANSNRMRPHPHVLKEGL